MILLIDRRPLGTSMEMADYGTWVRRQPLLALPGTPIWTTVQTQVNESIRRQIAALEPGGAMPLEISFEQMQIMAITSITSGSRGLMFASSSPLDANDTETRHRGCPATLEFGIGTDRALGGGGRFRHHWHKLRKGYHRRGPSSRAGPAVVAGLVFARGAMRARPIGGEKRFPRCAGSPRIGRGF